MSRMGEECLRYTPTPLRNLSQHRFEPILAEALGKLPAVDLRYGWQWQRSEQDEHGVTSTVQDLDGGESHEVRSRYVIAADGAGSRVRRSLGIEMQGPPRIQSFRMIHFGANLCELVRDRPGVLHFVMDPEAGGAFVAHDIDREPGDGLDAHPGRARRPRGGKGPAEGVEDLPDEGPDS